MSSQGLRIVCALPSEATALRNHFALQSTDPTSPFSLYANAERSIWLTISGIGSPAAAAAVAHLAAVSEAQPHHAWLNAGICGHHAGPTGRVLIAHKVIDTFSDQAIYPPLIATPPCETDVLRTVGQPCTTYAMPGMVDMEAAAFYAAASRYTTHELIQVLKVVSDCPDSPLERIRKANVLEWMSAAMPALDALSTHLLALSQQESLRLADPPGLTDFRQRWRFSQTQTVQLRKLLTRWAALSPAPCEIALFETATSSRQVLSDMSKRLASMPLLWRQP